MPGGNDFYAVKKSGRGSVRVAGCFCRGRPGGSLWGGGPSTAVAAVGTQRRHPGRRHGRRGGQRWLRAAIGAGPGGQEVGVRASCVSQPLPKRGSLLSFPRWWTSALPEFGLCEPPGRGRGRAAQGRGQDLPQESTQDHQRAAGKWSPSPQPGPGVAWQSQAVSGGCPGAEWAAGTRT